MRQFPHVKGNWPTYVYLKVPLSNASLRGLCVEVGHRERDANRLSVEGAPAAGAEGAPAAGAEGAPAAAATEVRFIWEDEGFESHLHVSLSRPMALRYHMVDSFVDQVRRAAERVGRFRFALKDYTVFPNDDRSRFFLVLYVSQGAERVRELIGAIDGVLGKFDLRRYYEDPVPHASFAYSLVPLRDVEGDTDEVGPFEACSVEIKVGNRQFSLPLGR